LKDAFDDPDRNPDWVENDNKTLEKLRQMGVRLTEVSTPNFPMDVSSFGVESGAFFDELVRSGRVNLLTTKNRGTSLRASRLTPAVEFLQIQRLRTMMMQKLAEATAGVDVYLAPSTNSRPTPPGGEGGGGGGGRTAPRGPMAQHFSMANLACYPGVALPNGFAKTGAPTSITFYGQPFREMEVMALAKAYQDATGINLKQPPLFAV
jgi:Asp-tRNA(Asn)/Glu-tRNA(Gln) amidotransferase A subunit family amidase